MPTLDEAFAGLKRRLYEIAAAPLEEQEEILLGAFGSTCAGRRTHDLEHDLDRRWPQR